MYFQLNPPSISQIRASFIVEKLANYPQSLSTINIFATGRNQILNLLQANSNSLFDSSFEQAIRQAVL